MACAGVVAKPHVDDRGSLELFRFDAVGRRFIGPKMRLSGMPVLALVFARTLGGCACGAPHRSGGIASFRF